MSDQTTTIGVQGMTCGHCVSAVDAELRQVPGVTDVHVDLVTDGTSQVTITSTGALPDDAVRAAVDEAGYTIAPPRSLL